MTPLGAFRDLCMRASARGLHVELHCGEAKKTGKGKETYRDLTLIRVTRTKRDAAGRITAVAIPYQRATSWRSLDADAAALLDQMGATA